MTILPDPSDPYSTKVGVVGHDRTERIAVTPFEHYMLIDTARDVTTGDCYRFSFRGVVERPRFEAAVRAVLNEHPLLMSIIRGKQTSRTGALYWQTTDVPVPLHWERSGSTDGLPNWPRPIDLAAEPPLRVYVQQQEKGFSLILQIHHAAADALGVFRFMQDVLAHYGGAYDATIRDTAKFADRCRFDYGDIPMGRRYYQNLVRVAKYFSFSPSCLRFSQQRCPTGDTDRPELAAWPPATTRRFDVPTTERLIAAAKSRGVTVNDLLLAGLFLTLGSWNFRSRISGENIRVAMPLNMRQTHHRWLPAANIVSMCFLDRMMHPNADRETLVRGIRRETALIKELRLGSAMLGALRLSGCLPGGLEAFLRLQAHVLSCPVTSVLSNIGVAFQGSGLPRRSDGCIAVAEIVLVRVEALAPSRPSMPVGFTATTYAGRLGLTLSYDPSRVNPSDANSLIVEFADSVAAFLGS